jgi:hypothetical protein
MAALASDLRMSTDTSSAPPSLSRKKATATLNERKPKATVTVRKKDDTWGDFGFDLGLSEDKKHDGEGEGGGDGDRVRVSNGGVFGGLTFALELGLGVGFKEKSAIKKIVEANGGKISYIINKKVGILLNHIQIVK